MTQTSRTLAAVLTAAVLVLAACASTPKVEPSTGVSGVVLWPQHGDFLLYVNKAQTPVWNYEFEGKQENADYLRRISQTPQARWLGDWMDDTRIRNFTERLADASEDKQQTMLVAFAGDPGAECGLAPEEVDLATEAYLSRLHAITDVLAERRPDVWVFVEPSSLSTLGDCEGQGERMLYLRTAIEGFAAAGATVYVPAGSIYGPDADEMAARLLQLPLDLVAGIQVNEGGYNPNDEEAARAEEILSILAEAGFPDLGYVIDTSRNGVGTAGPEPCNPPGQAIGMAPRKVFDEDFHAYVWVNRPGESDGSCNGGTTAGQWSNSIALELARNGDPEQA